MRVYDSKTKESNLPWFASFSETSIEEFHANKQLLIKIMVMPEKRGEDRGEWLSCRLNNKMLRIHIE